MKYLIGKIWPWFCKYKWSIALALFLSVCLAVILPFINYLFKPLFDDIFGKQDQSKLSFVLISFPLLFLLQGICRYFQFSVSRITAENIIADIRICLMRKFLNLNLSFYMKNKSGSGGLISRMFNDLNVLQVGIQNLFNLFRDVIISISLLGYLFYISFDLAIKLLIFVPLFGFIISKISRSIRKYGHKNQESLEELTSASKEGFDGIRVIKSFNLEDHSINRFSKKINEYLHIKKKMIRREEVVSPSNEFLAAIMISIIIYFQFVAINGGLSTTGTFMAFIATAAFLQQPLKRLQRAIIDIQHSIPVAERLFSVLENSDDLVSEINEPISFPKDWKKIEFKNVSFSYSDNQVLKNVSLSVNRGEVLALVGESGSGKSTLVNLLERFFDPTHGSIEIDGIDISKFALKELRNNISLITQDVFLFDDSLENNIRFGNLNKNTDSKKVMIENAAKLANAHNFISKLKNAYSSLVGERGGFLSGGERQRVSIARAIYKEASILILDEATSALDSASEVEVQKGLDKLLVGKTAFVIAHRLSTVKSADKIIVMKNGEVKEVGSHKELIALKGEYENLHSIQTKD